MVYAVAKPNAHSTNRTTINVHNMGHRKSTGYASVVNRRLNAIFPEKTRPFVTTSPCHFAAVP